MSVLISIIILSIIYWIIQKIRHSRGLVGAMIYNEDLGFNPYSKHDMELVNNIRKLGGKISMSEIIVFKWYLLRNIFGLLGTNDIYKIKSLELNKQLDKAFFNGFGRELKIFSANELELRLMNFYLINIPLYVDIYELENMSDEEIFSSIIQDDDIIENLSYLLLNGIMTEDCYNNPLFVAYISDYIKRHLYMNRILLRDIILNPQMLII